MAESFVDIFKSELIADRIWRSRSQLEMAIVECVSCLINEFLHESLGDTHPLSSRTHTFDRRLAGQYLFKLDTNKHGLIQTWSGSKWSRGSQGSPA